MVRKEAPRYLFLVTFFFGLVHGFGFSYVLRDEVGLPSEALVPALAAFNVGVEVGQIGIVLILYPLRRWVHEKPFERHVIRGLAGLCLLVATWWFIERTFLNV